ncbi:MAG: phosphoribosylglycinamide formyltransferase [Prevotellaceae bacterium]|nr:phosphoribosylglycinamide formyltransferase [Prevotellaceae bacterium]
MKKIAVFASGSGTNAENLIRYFNIDHPEKQIVISLIVSNRPDAFVLERVKELQVPSVVINNDSFSPPKDRNQAVFPLLEVLATAKIDFIVLAGFLRLIPQYLLDAYPNRIVNIHPALLPAYGGTGMYGKHVHQAVIANGEKESGISIHLADSQYDHGRILFQVRCRIDFGETPDSLAQKIHLLEQEHFPRVINDWINGKLPQ